MLAATFGYGPYYLYAQSGFARYLQLRRDVAATEVRNAKLRAENERLVREAETSGDKATALDRARKAEQLLKAALVLDSKLDGPDTVARYRVLLDKAIALQDRSPERKDERRP